MKSFLFGGVAAAVLATAAVAQTPQAAGQAKVHTRADVTARVQKQFARLDADRDGAITQAEVQAQRAQRGERRAKRTERMAGQGPGQGDPAQRFARLDTNRDGQITRAEFDARVAARAQRRAVASASRPQAGERLFARLDTNRDGAITQAEFQVRGQAGVQRAQRLAQRAERRANRPAGARMGGRFGGHMFAMADANKDGRLTLQEAQAGALTHFDRADVNRDGQVTREERRQLRLQMRAHTNHQG